MSKIIPIMNLISGLLLAYDFMPKSGKLLKFHTKLRRIIEQVDTDNPTSKGALVFNMLLSLFIFLLFLCWVYYKNRNAENEHFGGEILSFFIGIVVAFTIITIINRITFIRNLLKSTKEPFTVRLIYCLYCFALVFVVIAIMDKIHLPVYVVAGSAAAVYMFILFPLASIAASHTRKALLSDPNKDYRIFAVLGFFLFISSSVIQIFGD